MSKEYVKVDVDYYHNSKIVAAGARAELLYLRALCFANHTRSDGYIGSGQITAFVHGIRNWRGLVVDLVAAGLWEPAAGGWRIVDFLQRNRSRAEIDEISQKRAEAGRLGGRPRERSADEAGSEPSTSEQRAVSERSASHSKRKASCFRESRQRNGKRHSNEQRTKPNDNDNDSDRESGRRSHSRDRSLLLLNGADAG